MSLPTPTPTRTLTAPAAPPDDIAAIRAAAAALRGLADELRRRAAELATLVPPSWHGGAAVAATTAAHRLAAALSATAAVLDEDATALEVFAAAVAAAKLHHHHWLKILGEVAGTVAVTALVVTATVATGGAAGVVVAAAAVDAGVDGAAVGTVGTVVASSSSLAAGAAGAGSAEATAGAAVAGMGGAVAEASSAEATLIESLTSRILATLPKLKPLAQQQLVGAEVYTGVETGVHLVVTGRLDLAVIPAELITNIATGMAVGGVAAKIGGPFAKLAGAGSIVKGRGVVAGTLRHLSSGLSNGGLTAAEEELESGRISAGDVGESIADGGIGSVAGDLGAAAEPRISRGVNRLRAQRLPLLSTDADGVVAGPLKPGTYRVDPEALRFSQNSINLMGLRRDMLAGGWNGHPLDAVLMPDGKLTSLDNRRIAISRDLRLQAQVRFHSADEPLPAELLASGRFSRYHLGPGSTWLDLVQTRLSKQGSWAVRNAAGGLELPPKVTEGRVQVVGIRAPLVVVTRAQ